MLRVTLPLCKTICDDVLCVLEQDVGERGTIRFIAGMIPEYAYKCIHRAAVNVFRALGWRIQLPHVVISKDRGKAWLYQQFIPPVLQFVIAYLLSTYTEPPEYQFRLSRVISSVDNQIVDAY